VEPLCHFASESQRRARSALPAWNMQTLFGSKNLAMNQAKHGRYPHSRQAHSVQHGSAVIDESDGFINLEET
jgi:hypothetical protein